MTTCLYGCGMSESISDYCDVTIVVGKGRHSDECWGVYFWETRQYSAVHSQVEMAVFRGLSLSSRRPVCVDVG